jgi:PAS domain S-box-containing protein
MERHRWADTKRMTGAEAAAGALAREGATVSGATATFSLDAEGTIRRWNQGSQELLGWSAAEVLGRDTSFLAPPERLDEQQRLVRQCARHGRSERVMTQRLHKDGSRVDILLTLRPVRDEEGRLLAVLGQAVPAEGAEARAMEFERVVRQLTAMTEVALAAAGETSSERVVERIVERGRTLVENRGLLLLRREETQVSVAAGGDTDLDLAGASVIGPAPLLRRLFWGQVEGPVHLNSGVGMPVIQGPSAEIEPRQALLCPMRFGETTVGWLLAFERRADQAGFSDDEAQLLRAYASMAAASLATVSSGEDERMRRSIEASEQERARLARELHDQTLQGLGGMRVMLAYAAQSDDPEVMKRALDEAVHDLGEEIEAVRRMSIDLRPAVLDDLGLGAALEGLIERHRATGTMHLEAVIQLEGGAADEPISRDSERTVYRIVQECLTNVAKHAEAGRASVRVWRGPEHIAIEVEDDGNGFDTAEPASGFGLSGMRERATMAGGTLRAASERGAGTTVRATVPTNVASSGDR